MELLIIALALFVIAAASVVAAADSRPGLDDEPHRSI